MADEREGLKPSQPGANCDDVTSAALEVEQKLSRMQDAMTEAVQPDGDEAAFVGEMIEELDVAPEVEDLRGALGMDEQGSRALPRGLARERQDLKGDAQKVEAKAARRPASPEDRPPEYQTWRTGP